ncbi:hypothetical protein SCLCIDRAFT_33149 [Scleroderma citrinum Foug A]|uniref:Uncharacterized protein n=1 Tax=Scleroderma citrinum Foug A TaxID=1036808 RepID=A0A0C3CTB1_9AGAM|nr:hypothetical protein SCLCIDRAFT_33149 [Scleroderma citrinum Foug A]
MAQSPKRWPKKRKQRQTSSEEEESDDKKCSISHHLTPSDVEEITLQELDDIEMVSRASSVVIREHEHDEIENEIKDTSNDERDSMASVPELLEVKQRAVTHQMCLNIFISLAHLELRKRKIADIIPHAGYYEFVKDSDANNMTVQQYYRETYNIHIK